MRRRPPFYKPIKVARISKAELVLSVSQQAQLIPTKVARVSKAELVRYCLADSTTGVRGDLKNFLGEEKWKRGLMRKM